MEKQALLERQSTENVRLKILLCEIVSQLVDEMSKPHYHNSGFPPKTALKERLFNIINETNLDGENNE